jgi:uncharacterized protein (TIGR03435 family)
MQTLLALALVFFAMSSPSDTNVTGTWSGPMFSITFQQDGNKLSGKGGPDPKEQYSFTGGTVDGDRLQFKVGAFEFDLRVGPKGDEIKGQMKAGDQTMDVSVKRIEALKNRVAPTAFEVASIKPNNTGGRGSSTHSRPGGEIMMENVSLKQIIQMAYDVRNFSLNGPDWMDTVRFDILAKPPSEVNRDEMKVLIQSLLVDRFKLQVHRETKTMSAYELVAAKGGIKLKPVEPGPGGTNSNTNAGKGVLTAQKTSMANFANWLGTRLDRPVVDKTEATGVFDIKLEFSIQENQGAEVDVTAGPTIYTAIQEQLGLKLVAQKLPVEILVVDHLEKVPTEN